MIGTIPVEDVRSVVEKARPAYGVYGRESGLVLDTPEGFNGFESEWDRRIRVMDWLEEKSGR